MIKIYVGYVLSKYPYAYCMSIDKEKVGETLKYAKTKSPTVIYEYELETDKVIGLAIY